METPSSPSSKVTPPPALTLTSASPTATSFARSRSPPNLSLDTTLASPTFGNTTATSTDSTPVQTPTQVDDDDDGEHRWIVRSEEEESLRWSLGMENGHFATTLIPSSISSPTTTSIPIPGDHSYMSYTKSGGVEMGTSPPFSDLKESVVGRGAGGGRGRGGSVYWDWGTAAGVALGGEEEKKESVHESINLTNGGGGTGLTPPQRRRVLEPKKGSGTSSSSGSDSDSKNSTSTPISTPPSTARSITPKQKAKPPILTIPTSTLTFPRVTSPSVVQSPNRGSHGHRHYQSMPSFMDNSKSPSTPGGSDAIYQALVREWCFAQGPSSSTSGEATPVPVQNPSPLLGLTCALRDGE